MMLQSKMYELIIKTYDIVFFYKGFLMKKQRLCSGKLCLPLRFANVSFVKHTMTALFLFCV